MKPLIPFCLACLASCGFAQGLLHFNNTPLTLISANGSPMPVSGEQRFYFALFLASSTTVDTSGITLPLTDPNFQSVEAYNTNSSLAAGRLAPYPNVVTSYPPGSTVDFVVRGWSANAGNTWEEALKNWNGGSPYLSMFIGSSTVGNDLVISGGAQPYPTIFGTSALGQVPGFDMPFIPEPSTLALAVLGGAALCLSLHRRGREAP
jgi:hypothetical protein